MCGGIRGQESVVSYQSSVVSGGRHGRRNPKGAGNGASTQGGSGPGARDGAGRADPGGGRASERRRRPQRGRRQRERPYLPAVRSKPRRSPGASPRPRALICTQSRKRAGGDDHAGGCGGGGQGSGVRGTGQASVISSQSSVTEPTQYAIRTTSPAETIVPLTSLRRVIGERMSQSAATAPHVTLMTEAEATNLVSARAQSTRSLR